AARAAAAVPDADVVALEAGPDARIPVTAIVAALRERGVAGIAAEGGPALAAQLVEARLVDELCLTVVPRLGGPGPSMLDGDAVPISPLTARQLLVDDAGAQYGRWALTR
uniref:dihydrofolate reductase family protein n=1 Tax=Microcella sp. TaxID=1913979 RepID=UPI003F719717